jgi:acyl-CoA synthetase (AMP-forming)/AMP-acid ligase II
MIRNVGELIEKRTRLTPDREAFIFPDTGKRATFDELNRRSNCVAHGLLSLGVQRGDRIGMLAMNCLEFVEMHFASMKIGSVMVPMNWRLLPNELEYIVNNSGMKRLVYGADQIDTARSLSKMSTAIEQWVQIGGEELLEGARSFEELTGDQSDAQPEVGTPPSEGDDLYIMYTSGTTGRPKGAVHTHSSCLWGITNIDSATQFDARDKYVTAMPMFHAGGFAPLMVNFYRGVPSVVLQSFEPERMLKVIQEESATCSMMVPAMVQFLEQVKDFETRFDISSMRWIHCGAAPVPTSLASRFMDRGIALLQGYGQTETGGIVCVGSPESCVSRADSTGKSLMHVDLKVVAKDGTECAPGVAGEVVISSKCVMRGYWNNPEATADTIRDGWLHTGDVASIDEEGFVTIRDRTKDMIISGGENVYSAELEDCILRHPKVTDAGVIGQPSDKWGESPLAVVVAGDGSLTADELLQYCSENLAPFKRPKGVEFVEALPRNASGKILKAELRKQFPGPAPV